MTVSQRQGGGVQKAPQGGLAEVLDLILDKGLVIDAFVKVSLVGIELITIDARIVVASVGRYAVATVVKEVSGETGAVHVAFLIRRDHRTDFERAVDDLGDQWSGRVDLRLFGPTACFDFLPEYDVPDQDGGG